MSVLCTDIRVDPWFFWTEHHYTVNSKYLIDHFNPVNSPINSTWLKSISQKYTRNTPEIHRKYSNTSKIHQKYTRNIKIHQKYIRNTPKILKYTEKYIKKYIRYINGCTLYIVWRKSILNVEKYTVYCWKYSLSSDSSIKH